MGVAGLKICNNSGEYRNLAIGYKAGKAWVSEGWWKLENGECTTVVKQDLKNRFFYYRATTRKGEFVDDGYNMCSSPKAFTIEGDKQCKKRGYERTGFAKIDTGPKSKSFTFSIKPQQSALKKAKPAGPQPGTYGEPLSITAVFAGCDRIDGVLACDLTSEGWTYRVIDDGRSPERLLERLDELAINQGVAISGDLVSQGDKSVEITIRSVKPLRDSKKDRLLNGLIGSWRSLDDKSSVIRFTQQQVKYDYYNGALMESGRFELTRKCPELPSTSLQPLLVVSGKGGASYCYDIATISREYLDLIYLPRGNMLRYSRAEN
jgi:uncharacterized membrane protein